MTDRHTRSDSCRPDELRPISFPLAHVEYAEGSMLVEMGRTRVLCNVSVEEKVPPWMSGSGVGWLTAKYALLPRSTPTRTLTLDCDVPQADGGTRTGGRHRALGGCGFRYGHRFSHLGEVQNPSGGSRTLQGGDPVGEIGGIIVVLDPDESVTDGNRGNHTFETPLAMRVEFLRDGAPHCSESSCGIFDCDGEQVFKLWSGAPTTMRSVPRAQKATSRRAGASPQCDRFDSCNVPGTLEVPGTYRPGGAVLLPPDRSS